MNQSKELTAFYTAWLEWAENGAENHSEFARFAGLCDGAMRFHCAGIASVHGELVTQFLDAGLDDAFPFGYENWSRDYYADTMHLCPIRVKWVKDHIPA